MDASHFDELTRTLTTGTRRGVVRVLTALPLLGGLLAFLDPAEGEAKGQRKRHKKPHHHRKHTGNRSGKKKKRRCKADSKAKTCAGKCGSLKNNCKKTVDCGSCVCDPPCPVCQSCDASTGQCINLANGTTCGEGLQCQAGQCACDGASCADGCCQEGQCHVDDDDACGIGGGSCTHCTVPQTCGGGGTPSVCGCTPNDPCTAGVCGTVPDTCGDDVNCGNCGTGQVCAANLCVACGSESEPCCDGNTCESDIFVCLAGTCEHCGSALEPCCANDICDPLRVCLAGTCEFCGASGEPCCAGNTCLGGRTCSGGQCL